MGKFGRRCLLITVPAIAVSGLAQGQTTTTAFDGNYVGVSRVLTLDETRHRSCTPSGALATLTISNGVARLKWPDGSMEGPVNSQGVLAMRASNGAHVDAQIDAQGGIKGRSGNFHQGGSKLIGCGYDLTWQKQH